MVTVPNMNESTLYGRLVRRFNPEVYAMHNISACTREGLRKAVSRPGCRMLHCGTLGGCDVDFLPDRRISARCLAGFFRMLNPAVNAWNQIMLNDRLREFPATASTLAAVAIKSQIDRA